MDFLNTYLARINLSGTQCIHCVCCCVLELNFIKLPKQEILLNNFLLSRNEQDTSHKMYT